MEFFCGIDEVGRGSLAGPIMAGAALSACKSIYLYQDGKYVCPIEDIRDSKKYTKEEERRAAYTRILHSQYLVDFGIGSASVEEIDRLGINRANALAFQRALADLSSKPEFLLVDGVNNVEGWPTNKQAHMPKADGIWWPVAAASILAKVVRDELMVSLGLNHPDYYWNKNSGYGTPQHQEALKKYGATPHHRKKFIGKIIGPKEAICQTAT
jgi:ribonuclease HII